MCTDPPPPHARHWRTLKHRVPTGSESSQDYLRRAKKTEDQMKIPKVKPKMAPTRNALVLMHPSKGSRISQDAHSLRVPAQDDLPKMPARASAMPRNKSTMHVPMASRQTAFDTQKQQVATMLASTMPLRYS